MSKRLRRLSDLSRMGVLIGASVACAFSVAISSPVRAESDPAVVRVETLNEALVTAARRHDLTSDRLRPLLQQAFNLPIMAQLAVGQAWGGLSATEREEVLSSLLRYTEARYIHEFKGFSSQTLVVDPNVQVRGLDHLVRAEVREPGEAPTKLGYRLRDFGGAWKIIDVFYEGVSQVATQRSDFASALASGGASALVLRLDQATAKLK